MLNNTQTTFAGNLASDPTLEFTSHKGIPVVEFTVIVNRRTQNTQGEWVDGTPTSHTCKLYGQGAENAAESLTTGERVLVTGTVQTDTWTDKETGTNRYRQMVIVDEIGASLAYAAVRIERNPKKND